MTLEEKLGPIFGPLIVPESVSYYDKSGKPVIVTDMGEYYIVHGNMYDVKRLRGILDKPVDLSIATGY